MLPTAKPVTLNVWGLPGATLAGLPVTVPELQLTLTVTAAVFPSEYCLLTWSVAWLGDPQTVA